MNSASRRSTHRLTCFPLFVVAALMLMTWNGEFPRILQAQSSITVSIDGARRYQTIDGFGVSANSASWNNGELKPAIDLLVDQLGATLWRVVIDNGDWEAVNDNSDPNVFNWTYYNSVYTSPRLEKLWGTIAYLNQKGITDGVMIDVMGPVASWLGGSQITPAAEDEWVEMIASLVYYGRVSRGLQFGTLAPTNEQDWDGIEGPQISPTQYVRLLRKLALKLDSLGLNSLRLIGPDNGFIDPGVSTWMPQMMTDSVVMGKVDHFAFHDYAGGRRGRRWRSRAPPTPRATSGSPKPPTWRIFSRTSFRARRGADLGRLRQRLQPRHSALAGARTPRTTPATARPCSPTTRRPASTRRERSSTRRRSCSSSCDADRSGSRPPRRTLGVTTLAFHDQSGGRLTIVGRNTSTGTRTLSGTIAGVPTVARLELYQTTASGNLSRGTDVTVANGAFSVQVSGSSVFTLTTTTAADTAAPVVAMTEPGNGARLSGIVSIAAAASDNVGVAGVQFLLDGAAVNGEVTTAPYTTSWNTSTVSPGSHQLSARARDAAGNSAVADPLSVSVDNSDSTPPSVTITAPAGGSTISATVTINAAAVGQCAVAGVQFLLDDVALGSEDTGAPYAISWNTTTAAAGSHRFAGRARDTAGNLSTSASVTVSVSNGSPAPPTGLVAAYAFNEGSGTTIADNAGLGHTGSISGPAWTAVGRFGGGLRFDGVNDVVAVADRPDLDFTSGMTLEAWHLPDQRRRVEDRGPQGSRWRAGLCALRQRRTIPIYRAGESRDNDSLRGQSEPIASERLESPDRDLRRRHPAPLRQRCRRECPGQDGANQHHHGPADDRRQQRLG